MRETVAEFQAALQEGRHAALRQLLAEDFIGNDGLDRDGARGLAAGYRLRYRELGIVLGPLDVEFGDGHATVRTTAMLRGGAGRLLPDAASVYSVESGWRQQAGQWQMVSARWQPVL